MCLRSLREMPAELMRPAAPKAGRRTLLEKLPFLWKRFNFSQKVAARNLLRYKKRMVMTIVGVAGCTALMFVGFGLRDAVTTIVQKQYGTLQSYEVQVDLKQNLSPAALEEFYQTLAGAGVAQSAALTQQSVEVVQNGQVKTAYLTVPQNTEDFSEYIVLRQRQSGQPLALAADSVVVSEKLASILGLAVGDSLTLRDADGRQAAVAIGGIAENYLNHYIYMSPALYEKAFGSAPAVNQVLCKTAGQSGEALSQTLLQSPAVSSVTLAGSLRAYMEQMVGALRYIVLLLIASAAALVFVVLFSLTSIGIEERKRELATLKVLGFYTGELAAYLYRESTVLTAMGTALGLGLGVLLQRYIIVTMEIDMVMFSRDLLWQSYVFAAGLTLLFAVLVNFIMARHLKRIDMVSSLKSVE
ncbi:MAG: ABC transporter permease [Oscillospiraceae bacterium]